MHPTEVDPGVTLAGRYRVAELLAEVPGDGGVARTWRAVDEVLSRSVVVHVLAADDPRADGVLEASRRAATVDDVRFVRVLDALREDGIAYVVREWVQGRTLAELLADGPLPPRDAGLVVREVAAALASAHEQELYHERLDPDCVVVTDAGSVKIVGLATHVALGAHSGAAVDPERADSVGLGRLLYAALTARWPTGPRSGLSAAPRAADGTLLSPRQVRAGVPRALDEITERVLSDRPRHGSALRTPRDVVDALTGTVGVTPPEGVLVSSRQNSSPAPFGAPALGGRPGSGGGGAEDPERRLGVPVPNGRGPSPAADGRGGPPRSGGPRTPGPTSLQSGPPAPGGYGSHGAHGGHGSTSVRGSDVRLADRPGGPATDARPLPAGYAGPNRYGPSRRSGPRWSRIAIIVVSLVFLAGAGLLGWQLVKQAVSQPSQGGGPTSAPTATPTPRAQADNKPYPIVSAKDFDPPPKGNGEEHPEQVKAVYDGNPATIWHTMEYYDPLEQLKPGVGVWVDLGQDRQVGRVDLTMMPGGTDVQVLTAPRGATSAPTALDGWQQAGKATGLDAKATVQLDKAVTTRYVLIWMTKLPPDGAHFRGGIAEIVVRR